jgi:transposase, IS5 family
MFCHLKTFSFRYKAHLAVDEGSGLIRGAEMSGADLHDSQCFQALVQGDEAAVYADKAYASAAHRAQLKEAGIADGLMYRAARNRPLKPWQLAFNKAVAPIRAGVERSFATLKCHYRFRRARYLRLARNACHLKLLCTAVNLRRALVLAA